ncbi:MAG: ACT domain-containing protein [Halanaerobiales bacterium]|nr:ACT domain-containing protein [Bacillota bacterium]HOA41066.1 ACT domain-containing protein [Halanaerobiales bacterium]HPZ63181.1 ACT domain-containing protein [Halanaerobiales bacterium]HQD04287.1 ACT domain-containing protein [Halanaerobiales bacterium]
MIIITGEQLTLRLLEDRFAICKTDNNLPIPIWILGSRDFYSITRTEEEMSIIVKESSAPQDVEKEVGWRAFKIEGILDFSQTGILSSLSGLLAAEGLPVFVVSTYNTDYIFIKEKDLEKARKVLSTSYNILN